MSKMSKVLRDFAQTKFLNECADASAELGSHHNGHGPLRRPGHAPSSGSQGLPELCAGAADGPESVASEAQGGPSPLEAQFCCLPCVAALRLQALQCSGPSTRPEFSRLHLAQSQRPLQAANVGHSVEMQPYYPVAGM